MRVVPRRSGAPVASSVIVDTTAYSAMALTALAAALAAMPDPGLEFVLIEAGLPPQVEAIAARDGRVVRLHLPHARALAAMACNTALALATGAEVQYRLGRATDAPNSSSRHPGLEGLCHPRHLLSKVGVADPHLLLRAVWADDLCGRLRRAAGDQSTVPETKEELVRAALARPRSTALAAATTDATDVLASDFLPDSESVRQFQENWVIPFLARYWTAPSARALLAEHVVAARALRLQIRGNAVSAGAEIVFGNFARRFPSLLQVNRCESFPAAAAAPAEPDLLVNFRYAGSLDQELHARLRRAGRPVVYAMDDNLLRLTEMPYFAREPWLSQQCHVEAHLEDADRVLTWSARCAADVKRHNPRVTTLRTHIEAMRLPVNSSPPPAHGRLVYTTLTHNVRQRTAWWRQAVGEWAGFFTAHRDRARLVLFGADADVLALYAAWFVGVDYEVRPALPYTAYLDAIRCGEFHFVLAPVVEDAEFTRAKCPIKLLEATAAGAVLVASDVTAYQAMADGREGLKVGAAPGAWTTALERSLAMAPQSRQAIWAAACERVARDYTTEAQFLPVFLAYHTARLRAVLAVHGTSPVGSMESGPKTGAIPTSGAGSHAVQRILAVVPADRSGRRAVLSWAWLLRRQGWRIATQRAATAPTAARLSGPDAPVLVLAPSPWSEWVAAAHQAGRVCAALCDIGDVWPARPAPSPDRQPQVLLARGPTASAGARLAGWRVVRRLDVPMPRAVGPGCSPSALARAQTVFGVDAAGLPLSPICGALQVSGNGGAVIDAVLSAMTAGVRVFHTGSADAAELLPDAAWPGTSPAPGRPHSETRTDPTQARLAAAARSDPERIAHDLVCALVEAACAATQDPAPLPTCHLWPSTRATTGAAKP